MNYQQRFIAAAKFVYSGDSPVNSVELGVKATPKPHQIEGVSWLIRRYLLGVNVILGDEVSLPTLRPAFNWFFLFIFYEILCLLDYSSSSLSRLGNAVCLTDGVGEDFASYIIAELSESLSKDSWTILGTLSSKRDRWLDV
ncbi:hypothetical protein K7X08_008074 [Anisodus acutangulus]|uniref:Uncharacterized protein n=1 Tax=Anisodus acutangulus TaxID=402998 RepID=A0A9Q1MT04_9SOLA|nr:hypothetical protein K7X08_008074 [Anisodus acutangulus]